MPLKDRLLALHHPELIANPEGGDAGMVCQVWEDGEVTLTKGGSLWGQRNVHMIEFGMSSSLPLEIMPVVTGKHGYLVVICTTIGMQCGN